MQMSTNGLAALRQAIQDGTVASLAPAVKSPMRWSATFTPDGGDESEPPYRIELNVVIDDGRFTVEQMTCTQHGNGPPVTSEGLRAIPVARLLAFAAFRNVFVVKNAPDGSSAVTPFDGADLAEGAKRGPTDDVLRKVAVVYQVQYACGLAPTKGVEDSFKLARSTAGRWIAMARERGLLPPAAADASGTRTASRV